MRIIRLPDIFLSHQEPKSGYIFGAGKYGDSVLSLLDKIPQISVEGFIDNIVTSDNAAYKRIREKGVHKPDVLIKGNFDFVIVACRPHIIPQLLFQLYELNVDLSKIVLPLIYRTFHDTPDFGDGWNDYYEVAEGQTAWQTNTFIFRS